MACRKGHPGYWLEGPDPPLRPLPSAHGEGQTPDHRGHGNRTRDVGFSLGHRTTSRAAWAGLIGIDTASTHDKEGQQHRTGIPVAHRWGQGPGGESSRGTMWPTRSTPAPRSRKPRTNTRKCGIQPAHQSLQTVVSASLPPALRNSHISSSLRNYRGDRVVTYNGVDNEHQSTAFS